MKFKNKTRPILAGLLLLLLLIVVASLVNKGGRPAAQLTATSDLPAETSGPTLPPTASPTPDLPAMALTLAPVAAGQGVPGAAEYNPSKPGPHPLMILSTFGGEYCRLETQWNFCDPWDQNLPPGWLASSVDKVQLVVVLDPEGQVNLGSAPYTIGGKPVTVNRIRYEQSGVIREARTGTVLATLSFVGTEPRDFPEMTWENLIYGTRYLYSDLEKWMCPFVNPQGCQV
jgi:hypothetical protein